jgi:hypothetical protein
MTAAAPLRIDRSDQGSTISESTVTDILAANSPAFGPLERKDRLDSNRFCAAGLAPRAQAFSLSEAEHRGRCFVMGDFRVNLKIPTAGRSRPIIHM